MKLKNLKSGPSCYNALKMPYIILEKADTLLDRYLANSWKPSQRNWLSNTNPTEIGPSVWGLRTTDRRAHTRRNGHQTYNSPTFCVGEGINEGRSVFETDSYFFYATTYAIVQIHRCLFKLFLIVRRFHNIRISVMAFFNVRRDSIIYYYIAIIFMIRLEALYRMMFFCY